MLDYQQHERFGVYYLRPTPVRVFEGCIPECSSLPHLLDFITGYFPTVNIEGERSSPSSPRPPKPNLPEGQEWQILLDPRFRVYLPTLLLV